MKENVARAQVRENRQKRRKGEGQADAQRASRLLEAQGSERVKLTTVSSGSQKCLFNKHAGKLILHTTHL